LEKQNKNFVVTNLLNLHNLASFATHIPHDVQNYAKLPPPSPSWHFLASAWANFEKPSFAAAFCTKPALGANMV
jgi:hypothetical protein